MKGAQTWIQRSDVGPSLSGWLTAARSRRSGNSRAGRRPQRAWRQVSQSWSFWGPAGHARDEGEDTSTGPLATPIVAWTSEESGRPGSNWHHQLGRLRFYH
jgi:hypothetical protein